MGDAEENGVENHSGSDGSLVEDRIEERNEPAVDDGIRAAHELLGGKWYAPIMSALIADPRGFNDLKTADEVEGISGKVLSDSLKHLRHEGGLVDKTIENEQPIRVEYSATEAGESLEPVLRTMAEWNDTHDRHRDADRAPANATAERILGRKWHFHIVDRLDDDEKGFNELQDEVNGISNRVLSDSLDQLEEWDVVDRDDETGSPVRVNYSLTAAGEDLAEVAAAVGEWGVEYVEAGGVRPANQERNAI